jgi:VanZ family protein
LLLAVLVVGTSGLAFDPSPPAEIDTGWDKLNHVVAFSAMAFSACFAFAHARHAVVIALALLAFGVFIELVQSQIPARSAEAFDVLADGVGILAGLLPACAWQRRAKTR